MLAVQKLFLLGHCRGGIWWRGKGFASILAPVRLHSVTATGTVAHLSAGEPCRQLSAKLTEAAWVQPRVGEMGQDAWRAPWVIQEQGWGWVVH